MNKYTKWYAAITTAGKSSRDGYTERHHILPKSLGGDDSIENLTNLTAREHFICHWLLTKMYPVGEEHWKMINAFRMMRAENPRQLRYKTKVTARVYENLKKEYSKLQSERYSGEGNGFYGKSHSDEAKAKISAANKGRAQPAHEKEKQIAAMKGRSRKPFSEEWRKKLSEAKKGKKNSRYGIVVSEDTKSKISNAMKGRKQDPEVVARRTETMKSLNMKRKQILCPHCQQMISVNTYPRWHGENCKLKEL